MKQILFYYLIYFIIGVALISIYVYYFQNKNKIENNFLAIILFVSFYPILLIIFMWYSFMKIFIKKQSEEN